MESKDGANFGVYHMPGSQIRVPLHTPLLLSVPKVLRLLQQVLIQATGGAGEVQLNSQIQKGTSNLSQSSNSQSVLSHSTMVAY